MNALDFKSNPDVQLQSALVVPPDQQRHARAGFLYERIVKQRRQHAAPAPARTRRRKRQFAIEAAPAVIDRPADQLAGWLVCNADGRALAKLVRRERHGKARGYELRDLVVLVEDKL